MGEFRIGRKHASHSYPTARAIAGAPPSILQVGSDLIEEAFSVTSTTPNLNFRLPKASPAPGLLQVPLPGFRRANGLWVQISAGVFPDDTGDVSIGFEPWIKFSTLPQTFITPIATIVAAALSFAEVPGEVATQTFQSLTLTLTALFQLPAASSDAPAIALPAVDDILVGVVGFASIDVLFAPMTSIVAGEMNASIITQMPQVELITLT